MTLPSQVYDEVNIDWVKCPKCNSSCNLQKLTSTYIIKSNCHHYYCLVYNNGYNENPTTLRFERIKIGNSKLTRYYDCYFMLDAYNSIVTKSTDWIVGFPVIRFIIKKDISNINEELIKKLSILS